MKMFTNIVWPELVVVVIIIALILAKFKLTVFNFFFYSSFMTYFMMILKASFREARPYFVNTDIKPLQKYAEYGNPSGHVLLGYVVVSYLFDEFVYAHPCWTSCNVEEDHVCKGNKHGKYHWKKYAKQILHFFVVAMIFISRMYLGMHSFNQCLFSLICGIYCHLMYNAYFKDKIRTVINLSM